MRRGRCETALRSNLRRSLSINGRECFATFLRGRADLGRNFQTAGPDTVRLADISRVPTDEGWLRLAAVKDMATTEIIGWWTSDRLKGSLAIDAMRMALQNRRPAVLAELSFRLQRALRQRRLLSSYKARVAMSRKGNCLDNAAMESFFGSLKTALVHRARFRSHGEFRSEVQHR